MRRWSRLYRQCWQYRSSCWCIVEVCRCRKLCFLEYDIVIAVELPLFEVPVFVARSVPHKTSSGSANMQFGAFWEPLMWDVRVDDAAEWFETIYVEVFVKPARHGFTCRAHGHGPHRTAPRVPVPLIFPRVQCRAQEFGHVVCLCHAHAHIFLRVPCRCPGLWAREKHGTARHSTPNYVVHKRSTYAYI